MIRDGRVFIVAEAGVNHNGDPALARKLVDIAVESGADAVKFQTFIPEMLVTNWAEKAVYQKRDGANGGQLAMLRQLAIDEASHRALAAHARAQGIAFLSTPFDTESVAHLAALGLPMLKLGSSAVTHGPLLLAAARTCLPVVLSTGMSTLDEIGEALSVLALGYIAGNEAPSAEALAAALASEAGRAALAEKVVLLHCTTSYPAAFADANLRAMETLERRFGLRVGYSDHTPGIAVALAAAARGAVLVEKHFTADRSLPGPDHAASIERDELAAMVKGIREIEEALGSPEKRPCAAEVEIAHVARPSLVALRPISRGDRFTPENLGAKRPGTGVSPMRFWDFLGRTASRAYAKDELIEP
jgi:N-acetylneuraminate synthase